MVFAQSDPSNAAILSGLKELYEINRTEQTYELHCMETVCKICRLLVEQINTNKNPLTPMPKNTQTKRLQKIMTFIHAHYGEHISIDDMAKASTVSRTEVFRCFQAVLKKKPIEYLTEYRLSIATILLTSTDRTMSDISSSCGFNSASYFGKVSGASWYIPQKIQRPAPGKNKSIIFIEADRAQIFNVGKLVPCEENDIKYICCCERRFPEFYK